MRKKRLLTILIYLAIPLSLGLFIILQNMPLDGTITQKLNFSSWVSPRIISNIYPGDRTDNVRLVAGTKVLPITNDNAYFDITFPPISYDQLALTLSFSRPENVPEVRLGIPRGPEQYENVLLSHEYLDGLEWEKIEEGSLVLWQKEKQYDSIDDFLANPPQDKLTAVHPTAPTPQLFISDYVPNDQTRTLPAGLEGPHGLFTYIKGQSLRFAFTKTGSAEKSGSERARVLNFSGEEIEKLDISKPGDYDFDIAGLADGLYRIEILLEPANSIANITTNLDKLVAKNILWLNQATNEQSPIDIVFAGNNLTVTAPENNGLQEITVSDRQINIDEINRPEVLSNYFPEIEYLETVEIELIKTPARFEGKGFFAWDENMFFSPLPDYTFQLSPGTTPEKFAEADFVIAKCNTDLRIDGIEAEAIVEMPINALYKDNGVSPFVISTPGLARDCEEILLLDLEATLSRPPLSWAEIKKIISKII